MNEIPFFLTPVRFNVRLGAYLFAVVLYQKYEVFIFGWQHTDIRLQIFNLN